MRTAISTAWRDRHRRVHPGARVRRPAWRPTISSMATAASSTSSVYGRIYQPIGVRRFILDRRLLQPEPQQFGGRCPCAPTGPVPAQPGADADSGCGLRLAAMSAPRRQPLPAQRRRARLTVAAASSTRWPGYIADAANNCGSISKSATTVQHRQYPRHPRFTLADGVVLTVDPSFQYVKANGGGTVVAQEGLRDVNPPAAPPLTVRRRGSAGTSCQVGYFGAVPSGRDSTATATASPSAWSPPARPRPTATA